MLLAGAVLTASLGCDNGDKGGEKDPLPVCGNGVLEENEVCDGTDLGSDTCETFGYGGGTLACKDDCTHDMSGCNDGPLCGDGHVDTELGEQCEGEELGGATCESLFFDGGELNCGDNCLYDTIGCCINLCDALGDYGCGAETVQVCEMGPDGCRVWAVQEDCAAAGQICIQGASGPECVEMCDDLCPLEGDTQCNGDVVETCSLQPDGCFDWEATQDCSLTGDECAVEGTTALCVCTDHCPAEGETQCQGDWVQTCEEGASGCLEWGDTLDCSLTQDVCDVAGGVAQCVCQDLCSTQGESRCNGSVIEECELGTEGCLLWNEVVDCNDICGATCVDSGGEVSCDGGC